MFPKFFPPVISPYRISSGYGERKDPNPKNKGKVQFHDGIDLVSTTGICKVFAIADGIVEYDRDNYDHSKRWEIGGPNTVGNRIVLLHELPDGTKWRSLYFHLVVNNLSLGQKVKVGDLIGVHGDVGYSFGSHLHLKVTKDWDPFDPTPYLA